MLANSYQPELFFVNGFISCGLWRCDPEIFTDDDFVPSLITDEAENQSIVSTLVENENSEAAPSIPLPCRSGAGEQILITERVVGQLAERTTRGRTTRQRTTRRTDNSPNGKCMVCAAIAWFWRINRWAHIMWVFFGELSVRRVLIRRVVFQRFVCSASRPHTHRT